jgi:predicted hydrocarbon binding protein
MSDSQSFGRIKGAAVRQFLIWYRGENGDRAFDDCFARLAPEVTSELDMGSESLGIVASRWYDCRLIHTILEALMAELSEEEAHALIVEGSQAVMDHTLRGVYRSLFEWMANPKRYARHGAKIWSTYYDSGEFRIESDPESRRAVCTIRDWSSHHPILCDMNRGASAAIYRAMGLPDAECVRESCVARGGSECRFVTTW